MGIVTNVSKQVWDRLIKAGLTSAGAAGMMGNIYAESGMIPNRVEMLCLQRLREQGKIYTDATYTAFVDDGTISKAEFLHPLPNRQYGYGLTQSTAPSRKSIMYDMAKSSKRSIGDLDLQVDFLLYELENSFPGVLSTLKETTDIKTASDMVLKRFEMPADTGTSVQNIRYSYAREYYNAYASTGVTADTVIRFARQYIGCNEHDGSHRQIIDGYNAYKPLARGYKVQYTDAWCDTFVSFVFIKLNAVSLIGGTECGVYDHVLLFKKAGIWKGRVKPQYGDIIVFDWQQDGAQDHIGFVEKVEGNVVTTIEGNYTDAVKRRIVMWDNHQIAGYARPKYAAEENDPVPSGNDPVPSKEPVTAKEYAEKYDPKVAGKYRATTDLNMRDGKGTKYKILVTLPEGIVVNNYGYYSVLNFRKWLYVQVEIDGVRYTGFCSSKYLKKV